MEEKKEIKKMDTFNMQIEADLKAEFFKKCIDNKTSMSAVLKNYIQEYVNR